MAEERETSQTVENPASKAAPVELDIDSLLPNIPELKGLFAETPPAPEPGSPEQPKEEASVTEPGAPETAVEVQIPEGLKPEEEPPSPEPEPKKDDKIQKRIDELTAKRKAAEERATALETELSDLKSKFSAPPPVAPTAANPLADIETETDLVARANHIQEAKSWAIQNLDGGNVSDGKGGVQFVDGQTVKAILANAELMLSKHLPERKDFLVNKRVFDNEAKREYPALFKEGSEASNTFKQWLTVFPECRRYPDIALIVGDALVGQKIRSDRAKARTNNGKLPPASQQPLAIPAPAASPRVPQTKALSGQALAAAFDANPEAALDNFVDSLLDAGAARRAAQR
jgi:hypothetical protein